MPTPTRPARDLFGNRTNRPGRSYPTAPSGDDRSRWFAEEVDAIEGSIVSGRYSVNSLDLFLGGVATIDSARAATLTSATVADFVDVTSPAGRFRLGPEMTDSGDAGLELDAAGVAVGAGTVRGRTDVSGETITLGGPAPGESPPPAPNNTLYLFGPNGLASESILSSGLFVDLATGNDTDELRMTAEKLETIGYQDASGITTTSRMSGRTEGGAPAGILVKTDQSTAPEVRVNSAGLQGFTTIAGELQQVESGALQFFFTNFSTGNAANYGREFWNLDTCGTTAHFASLDLRGSSSDLQIFDGFGGSFQVFGGDSVRINGSQVLGAREAAITAPVGGATVDAEARTAINAILAALGTSGHGLTAN